MNAHAKLANLLLACVAVVAAGGCVRTVAPVEAQTPEPIVPDPAMALRNWPLNTAMYPNGDAFAGSTGFRWEAKADMPTGVYPFADLGIFLGNVVVMPYTLITEVPKQPIQYSGVEVPTDYTAVYPLELTDAANAFVPPPLAVPPAETAPDVVLPETSVTTPATSVTDTTLVPVPPRTGMPSTATEPPEPIEPGVNLDPLLTPPASPGTLTAPRPATGGTPTVTSTPSTPSTRPSGRTTPLEMNK